MWTDTCVGAFKEAKEALIFSQVLIHHDPSLPIRLAADASAYGIGAVLSHVLDDGTDTGEKDWISIGMERYK